MDNIEHVAIDTLRHRDQLVRMIPDLTLTRHGSLIALKRLQNILAEPKMFMDPALQQELQILINSADEIIRAGTHETEYLGEAGCIEVSIVLTDAAQVWLRARKAAAMLDRASAHLSAALQAERLVSMLRDED
ncbi:MAG: hypothetical protein Q4G22_11910 [Paracoccus sp. (in: a-proteobacteria)]|uniref:hypothetical protein n=1 Tax=Paracoccus sp. TaxID=267 RepID=UPI0026DF38EF|nr:hypothetical protein [Paracoccus sp. (in: a-proteobacteria)]MDO5632527.1 hypothetical protein [Paracoccus sp. (in: a-proteobacteria)]